MLLNYCCFARYNTVTCVLLLSSSLRQNVNQLPAPWARSRGNSRSPPRNHTPNTGHEKNNLSRSRTLTADHGRSHPRPRGHDVVRSRHYHRPEIERSQVLMLKDQCLAVQVPPISPRRCRLLLRWTGSTCCVSNVMSSSTFATIYALRVRN